MILKPISIRVSSNTTHQDAYLRCIANPYLRFYEIRRCRTANAENQAATTRRGKAIDSWRKAANTRKTSSWHDRRQILIAGLDV